MHHSKMLLSSNISSSLSNLNLLVIGGGSGGIACARKAAELGAKVALIESGLLGGTCVNAGCVPKKISYNFAAQVESLKYMPMYGIDVALKSLDWREFKSKRDAYIKKLNNIYFSNLSKSNVTILEGRGKFVGNKILDVNGSKLTADHIVVATGGYPSIPNISGADLGITSDEFFQLDEIPKSITIVGAGYIAVELCGILRSLGSEVNLIIRGNQVLRNFDSLISQVTTKHLEESGVRVIKNTVVKCVEKESDELKVSFLSERPPLNSQFVLWAIGRKPSSNLNLQSTNVVTDDDGHIKVDEYQNTSEPNVYALGDVCGKWLLTPVAIAAGRKLAVRLFGDDPTAKLDYTNIPSVIFSHPPVATIGYSEDSAINVYGKSNIKVYHSTFVPLYYSITDEKVQCHMKLICLKPEEKVIGLHIVGPGSDEMLQGFAVAIKMGATKKQFDSCVAIHPTSAEEVVTMR